MLNNKVVNPQGRLSMCSVWLALTFWCKKLFIYFGLTSAFPGNLVKKNYLPSFTNQYFKLSLTSHCYVLQFIFVRLEFRYFLESVFHLSPKLHMKLSHAPQERVQTEVDGLELFLWWAGVVLSKDVSVCFNVWEPACKWGVRRQSKGNNPWKVGFWIGLLLNTRCAAVIFLNKTNK